MRRGAEGCKACAQRVWPEPFPFVSAVRTTVRAQRARSMRYAEVGCTRTRDQWATAETRGARHPMLARRLSVLLRGARRAAHCATAVLVDHGEDTLLVLDIALHLKLIDERAEAVEIELADLLL